MTTVRPVAQLEVLRGRLEPAQILFLLYVVVFVRQFFWISNNNFLGWSLAIPLGILAFYFYIRTRPFPAQNPGREFWLIVAIPLLFLYCLRLPFPDISFDVLNYRLFHAERSLRGTLFGPGDFFPTAAPYNPAPDTLTAFFRLALGYRLGTIINLLALIWSGQILDKLLGFFVSNRLMRAMSVLLVMCAEQLLFELNTYMVDLLAVPLLLEATYLTLKLDDAEHQRPVLVHVALLLGVATALKLTNIASIVSIVVVCAYKAVAGKHRPNLGRLAATSVFTFLAFVAPSLPFTIYLLTLTGNPLFPLANKYFKSPFWETSGGWDARWGPKGFWETLIWPILSMVHPERLSELAVYSGRLTIGFVAGIACLAVFWRNARARWLCAIMLGGCLLWSAGGMGYSRYGLYLELLAGVGVIALASVVLKGASGRLLSWQFAVASVLVLALVAQDAQALRYVLTREWSMRPTALSDWRSFVYEARFIFRDRHLTSFLRKENQSTFQHVSAWIESGTKSTGIEVLLDPAIPAISVNHDQYLLTRQSIHQFAQAVEHIPGDSMFSLCLPEELASCQEFIRRRGLQVDRSTLVEVPFFSARRTIGMMLLEISRPHGAEAYTLEALWREAPFAESDYRAEINPVTTLTGTLERAEKITLRFRVRNSGAEVWPAHGNATGRYQVNLADRWFKADGQEVTALDGRASLLEDLQPGGEVELPLTVTAPVVPGEYILEVDLVHEGLAWFKDKGSKPLQIRVTVR